MKITRKFYLKGGSGPKPIKADYLNQKTLGVTQRQLADRIAGNRIKALEV